MLFITIDHQTSRVYCVFELGVITCQIHDNQLDKAASQLEFLNEVKDNIDRTPVGK